MRLRKLSVVLLALLLAAMAMVPMVSADDDQSQMDNEVKIRALLEPIDKDIYVIVAEKSLATDTTKTTDFSQSVSDILNTYDKDLDKIILHLDKITNVHLDSPNRTLLKKIDNY